MCPSIVGGHFFTYICQMYTEEEIDRDLKRLKIKMGNIPSVTKRYMRIRLKKRVKKLTGIKLR